MSAPGAGGRAVAPEPDGPVERLLDELFDGLSGTGRGGRHALADHAMVGANLSAGIASTLAGVAAGAGMFARARRPTR
jgi:hypothetical protein